MRLNTWRRSARFVPSGLRFPAALGAIQRALLAAVVGSLAAACNHGSVGLLTPYGTDFSAGTGDGGTAANADDSASAWVRDGGGRLDDGTPAGCGELFAIVRDFKAWDDGAGHPDFEVGIADEPRYDFGGGLPQWPHAADPYLDTSLDEEGKPRYLLGASPSPQQTIHGRAAFAQWYRDVDGVNQRFEIPLADQDPSDERFVFDSSELPGGQFFPVDEQGFGNQGRGHNFHFTTELRGTFRYDGGERFTFSGDDDVFVFVNHKLALDLGGVHGKQTATIDFDSIAGWLGIDPGHEYPIALFHAERHTTESNFRFETSIRCLAIK